MSFKFGKDSLYSHKRQCTSGYCSLSLAWNRHCLQETNRKLLWMKCLVCRVHQLATLGLSSRGGMQNPQVWAVRIPAISCPPPPPPPTHMQEIVKHWESGTSEMGTNCKVTLQCVSVSTVRAIKANTYHKESLHAEQTGSTTWVSEQSTPRTNPTESS